MKALFIFPLLTLLVSPSLRQTPTAEERPITVLGFKWSKIQQTTSPPSGSNPLPARAVSPNDKNFERTSRVNDPAGFRDPNADTLDARGQELEKNTRSANNSTAKGTDAFAYQAKIHNAGKSVIEVVFWEYQFIDATNPANVTRRQFFCGINLKADKDKELQAFSSLGPTTINAAAAASGTSSVQEKVLINRIEFADGKSWMRKDWNAGEIKDSYKRAMATPWSPNEMCRSL
jgi:hypothetical protein